MSVSWLLAGLFIVHFIAFLALSVRRRTVRYLPALGTFTLLTVLYVLQGLEVGGADLYRWLRGLAFLGLFVSVVSWWRRRQASQAV